MPKRKTVDKEYQDLTKDVNIDALQKNINLSFGFIFLILPFTILPILLQDKQDRSEIERMSVLYSLGKVTLK